jgi:hypothetical protein
MPIGFHEDVDLIAWFQPTNVKLQLPLVAAAIIDHHCH